MDVVGDLIEFIDEGKDEVVELDNLTSKSFSELLKNAKIGKILTDSNQTDPLKKWHMVTMSEPRQQGKTAALNKWNEFLKRGM